MKDLREVFLHEHRMLSIYSFTTTANQQPNIGLYTHLQDGT